MAKYSGTKAYTNDIYRGSMDRIPITIEALADSLVAMRPDRNTIVQTLHGLVRVAIKDHVDKQVNDDLATKQYLEDMLMRCKQGAEQP